MKFVKKGLQHGSDRISYAFSLEKLSMNGNQLLSLHLREESITCSVNLESSCIVPEDTLSVKLLIKLKTTLHRNYLT